MSILTATNIGQSFGAFDVFRGITVGIPNNQKRGWTDPICVRRPWRGQGLARALIMRSLRLLQEQGMLEACLGVDTHNPNGALQLYETCGYRQINSSTTYRKPL